MGEIERSFAQTWTTNDNTFTVWEHFDRWLFWRPLITLTTSEIISQPLVLILDLYCTLICPFFSVYEINYFITLDLMKLKTISQIGPNETENFFLLRTKCKWKLFGTSDHIKLKTFLKWFESKWASIIFEPTFYPWKLSNKKSLELRIK